MCLPSNSLRVSICPRIIGCGHCSVFCVELIEMLLGVCTHGAQGAAYPVRTPREGELFFFGGGNNWACPSLPTVNILNIIDKGGSSDATFGYLLPVTYLLLCLWEGCEMLWSVLHISKIACSKFAKFCL